MPTLTLLHTPKSGPMRVAIAMSGTGSNAKRIIERYLDDRDAGTVSFEPVVIFTDNQDSNAWEIAQGEYSGRNFEIPVWENDIRGFYKANGDKPLNNRAVRASYDKVQLENFKHHKVDIVALAGYDWVVTPALCNNFLTLNVHPGDLRVYGENRKRVYFGLAWEPSAKAILAGDNLVYTSVHQVTEELDGGPLLAVSAPQPVPDAVKAMNLEQRAELLGAAKSIPEISKYIRDHPDLNDEHGDLSAMFPIVGYASDCQERLKVNGDWVIFPETVANVAMGRYSIMGKGLIYFDGKPVPAGVDFGKE